MKRKLISLIMIFLFLLIGPAKKSAIVLAEENYIEQYTTSAQELEDYINFLELNRVFYTKESWESTDLDNKNAIKGLIQQGKDSIENNDEKSFDAILNRLKEEYGKLIPEINPNIVLGKDISAFWLDGTNDDVTSSDSPLSKAIDGYKDNVNNYAIFGNDNIDKPSYIQIDLGYSFPIKQVNLHRYWNDGRTYNDTALVISNDENFNSYDVLYYSSKDKDTNIFNLNIKPINDLYSETSSGYELFRAGENIPEARYIRLYGYGSDKNKENHIIELEVYSENNDPYKIHELTNLLNSAKEHLENTKADHNEGAVINMGQAILKFETFISGISGNNKTMGEVSKARAELNNTMKSYDQDIKMSVIYPNDIFTKITDGSREDTLNKIAVALNNGNTLNIRLDIYDALPYEFIDYYNIQISKINNCATLNNIENIYNYQNISLGIYDGSDYIGDALELSEDIMISFKIPEEILNAPKGMKRTFYIIHVHKDEDAVLIDDITINGNILTFKTNKFSVFSLGYKDEVIPPVIPITPPSTSDNSSSPTIEENTISTIKKPITVIEDKKDEFVEEVIEEVVDEEIKEEVVEKENTSKNQKEELKKDKFNIIYLILILCLLLMIIILIFLKRRKKDNE